MSIQELAQATFDNHHHSVVSILRRTPKLAMGSGFIIRSTDTSCLVMTCQHVITGMDPSNPNHALCVRLAGETTEYPADILHASEKADLAVLKVRKMPGAYPSLQFGDAKNVPPLTPVFLLAYNRPEELKGIGPVLTLYPSVSPGKSAAPARGGPENMIDLLYTLPMKRGTSGGAVISDGKVRGVHYQRVGQVHSARSAETVNFMLARWLGIPENVTRSTEEMIGMIEDQSN